MTANAAQTEVQRPRSSCMGAGEATQLANAARVARMIPRGSSRVVLALLLRHTRGSFAVKRSTRWIANEIAADYSTAKRSIDALVSAGFVVVAIPGGGRQRAAYLVDVKQLRELAISQKSEAPEGVRHAPPEGASCPPRGGFVPPPSARARSLTALGLENPPTPQTSPASLPRENASPAVGGAPFRQTGDIGQPCAHGRSVAQGGCRACGTTARQLVDERQRSTRLTELEQQRRDQAERRAREAELKAASKPPPADLRASIRKPKAKP